MALITPEFRVEGEGPDTVLFLHGLGGDHTNWQPQLEAFASTHRCVAWTLPGYGNSPALDTMTWAGFGDAAARVLDMVGAERATVVGLSMGGYIAQRLALDHGDRVAGLVLAATSARFGPPDGDFATRYLANRLAPLERGLTPAELAPEIVAGVLGPNADPAAAAICRASMSRITADAYREALAVLVTWDATSELEALSVDTLCVAASEDTIAPPRAMARLAAMISTARLEIVDGCGHLINLDQPAAFNRLLRAFLDR